MDELALAYGVILNRPELVKGLMPDLDETRPAEEERPSTLARLCSWTAAQARQVQRGLRLKRGGKRELQAEPVINA